MLPRQITRKSQVSDFKLFKLSTFQAKPRFKSSQGLSYEKTQN